MVPFGCFEFRAYWDHYLPGCMRTNCPIMIPDVNLMGGIEIIGIARYVNRVFYGIYVIIYEL